MRNTSLESKTIRPGSYSYYHSGSQTPVNTHNPKVNPGKRSLKFKIVATVAVVVLVFGFFQINKNSSSSSVPYKSNQVSKSAPAALGSSAKNIAKPTTNEAPACNSNTADKTVIVSLSKRHMWACEKSNQVKDAPIISGMEVTDSTKTPVGTFRIYGKVKDTALSGNDAATGPWRQPVNYWMPYHDNQYGTYGFHDAPWRKNSEFGNIDPNSMNGSHGCVQLLTDTAAWLYDWAPIGTTVNVIT